MTTHSKAAVKIKCEGLWKVFGDAAETQCAATPSTERSRDALCDLGGIIGAEDVSLEIAPGELFVIMGLSGSGKSTVLRCIAQLQRPSAGAVILDDQDLTTLPEKSLMDIRRHKMGMVFQNFGLVPHFTALENIAFPLKMRGEPKAQRDATAAEMLRLVGLEGRGDAYPSELSGGQQQRVGIARSLAVDPEVWLLDEPFSALDPLIRKQLQDELLALQARLQKTIIFVTHDFAEAVRLADRIAIMRDGRIIQQGRAADLLLTPADDYVRRFVGDVSRLQVLRLADVMEPADRAPKTVTRLPASYTLEQMLVAMPAGEHKIAVTDEAGRVIGRADRDALLAQINASQNTQSQSSNDPSDNGGTRHGT